MRSPLRIGSVGSWIGFNRPNFCMCSGVDHRGIFSAKTERRRGEIYVGKNWRKLKWSCVLTIFFHGKAHKMLAPPDASKMCDKIGILYQSHLWYNFAINPKYSFPLPTATVELEVVEYPRCSNIFFSIFTHTCQLQELLAELFWFL